MHVSEIYARPSQMQGNEGKVILIHNLISRVGNLISRRLTIGVSHDLRFHCTCTSPDHFCSPNCLPQVFQGNRIRKKRCDIVVVIFPWCLQEVPFWLSFNLKANQLAILKNCFLLLSRIGFFLHPCYKYSQKISTTFQIATMQGKVDTVYISQMDFVPTVWVVPIIFKHIRMKFSSG